MGGLRIESRRGEHDREGLECTAVVRFWDI
jgi:hypothetical protein